MEKQSPVTDVSAMRNALDAAMRSGVSGASAMAIQVVSLMWLRTTINHQYRYGGTTTNALQTLWKEGGVPRFYRGLLPALAQGPLSRFGDTFANTGVITFMNSHEATQSLPVAAKTVIASAAAAGFRILLMPIDTCKTIMQVEGKDGMRKLASKFRANGPTVFFHGAIGASAATFVGHYPWFATYNGLDAMLPKADTGLERLMRSALMGFAASAVSDTCSNSIRVLKTYRQTSDKAVSYVQAAKNVIAQDGVSGLLGRGLKTKIIANGMQGMLFSVLWKHFERRAVARKD
eukprot:TRINITY_DN15231_c0_g1_i1.p1 TRINITY_DN15231_c0_g1~~TRINITY_DN15231_c0_g1_i1.p1  ORF type:complete len:290 (-),score=68.33 TRINITY_DN15231_c0_g1_i1:57-926(-)